LSSDNPDIRQQVAEESGALKKLQLLIPGLRGYRKSENIRVADEYLRNQVADRLDQARSNLDFVRKQLVAGGDFTNLTTLGSLMNQIQQLSGEVRHSAQGYSGLAPSISITEDVLNKLYDYDYAFVDSAFQILNSTLGFTYDPSSPNSVQALISKLTASIQDFKQKWAVRLEAVENILQK
jgi:hypothetical protein